MWNRLGIDHHVLMVLLITPDIFPVRGITQGTLQDEAKPCNLQATATMGNSIVV
jgi:hypothetical protein